MPAGVPAAAVADLRTAGRGILGFGKRRAAVSAILYRCGRLLQVVGMVLLPLAIAGNLAPDNPLNDLRLSLTLSGVGVAVFGLGWLLQQAGRPR
jgi:hypothetical protein